MTTNYTRLDFLRNKFEEAAKAYASNPNAHNYLNLNAIALEYQEEFFKDTV